MGMTSINDALWSIMFRCRHFISMPNRNRRTDVTERTPEELIAATE